jgi:hypothetical protein
MVSDVYQVVAQCEQSLQERLDLRKPQGDMNLFPSHEPLDYVAIDILCPLPRTKNGISIYSSSLTGFRNFSERFPYLASQLR